MVTYRLFTHFDRLQLFCCQRQTPHSSLDRGSSVFESCFLFAIPSFSLPIILSVFAITMSTKAELVTEIYLLLATIHLHGFVMSPEMAHKIFDRWRESRFSAQQFKHG